jgi:hypothetical protein
VTPSLTALVSDFLERARDELPTRLHSRDLDAGGAPEWSRGFATYISDSGSATAIIESQDFCDHPTLGCAPVCNQTHSHVPRVGRCPICDGSGLRQTVRNVNRHPVKASMRRLRKMPVPYGRPRFDKVLWALLVADGNLGLVMQSLSPQYSCMGDERFASRWVCTALLKWRSVHREDVTVYRGLSESQAIAEVAA